MSSSQPANRRARELADRLEGVAVSGSSARPSFTNPFGKLDDEAIQAFKVPTVVKEGLKKAAAEAGLPVHEYLRELVTIAVMGRKAVQDAYAARVDAIVETLK